MKNIHELEWHETFKENIKIITNELNGRPKKYIPKLQKGALPQALIILKEDTNHALKENTNLLEEARLLIQNIYENTNNEALFDIINLIKGHANKNEHTLKLKIAAATGDLK